MKVYRPGSRGKHAVFVQPGHQFQNSDFKDESGKPKLFMVEFVEGCADVPDGLGDYMVDSELAARSPIIIPSQRVQV